MELITTEKQLLRLSKEILVASGADDQDIDVGRDVKRCRSRDDKYDLLGPTRKFSHSSR